MLRAIMSSALPTLLIIDDEKNIRRTLAMVLEPEGYRVVTAESAEEGLAIYEKQPIDCIVLDLRLPNMSGLDLLERLKNLETGALPVPTIVISGHGNVSDAVQATRLGAFDFLEKPLDRERVIITVRNALAQRDMAREVGTLRREVQGRFEMIGSSPVMKRLFEQIVKVAPTKGRVLITGESGTGKELIARALHDHSLVAKGPFVKVNCAAIPPELIESELFGHEKGAFTGALQRKRGLFEAAHGGTLFLDEIGDMSLAAQAKMLRVLQTGELTRVGGEQPILVDVRIIAATNKQLQTEVDAGRFREDLFFRLNVVPLESPPLRERLFDIPEMVEHFVKEFCQQNGFKLKRVHPDVIKRLQLYPWPGNVRELKNVIERVVIMSDDIIELKDLPSYLTQTENRPILGMASFSSKTLKEFREETEREFITQSLQECDWNISKTANLLGIERTNLHKKIRAYNIQRDHEREGNKRAGELS